MTNLLKKENWIQTFTGKQFDFLLQHPDDVDIIDIAWALAHQCRYAGHTIKHYSIAEHSVYLSRALPQEFKLEGLMHDASEAYLVDMPRPAKRLLADYARIEDDVMQTINQKFGGKIYPMSPIVKEYDTRILGNERRDICTKTSWQWSHVGEPLPDIVVVGWHADYAFSRFMDAYCLLTGQTNDFDRYPVYLKEYKQTSPSKWNGI